MPFSLDPRRFARLFLRARLKARRIVRFAKLRFTSFEERLVPATYTVTTTADTGVGSLRQAIVDANSTAGVPDTIVFAIGTGQQTIALASALPSITDTITLDGWSQPGWSAAPLIVLDGQGGTMTGLNLSANNSTIRGLVITNMVGSPNVGVSMGGSNNRLQGSHIGTNAAGSAAGAAQITYGVNVIGNGMTIGTDGDGVNDQLEGNLVSGNFDGVNVATGVNNVVIAGNRIGTNAAGTLAVGNASSGVRVNAATLVRVGTNADGTSDGLESNLISGNASGEGVRLVGTVGAVIAGNLIGTTASGNAPLANAMGVLLQSGATSITIGGTTATTRNIISGNSASGISVTGSDNNSVTGNYIGLGSDGNTMVANGTGISLTTATGTAIGDFAATPGTGAGNVISGNTTDGIAINGAPGTTIRGNLIGTDSTGQLDRGNIQSGISGGNGSGYTIGGDDDDDGSADTVVQSRNVISGNDLSAINLVSGGSDWIIQGNYVGTDIDGVDAIGNGTSGSSAAIAVASAYFVLIGGTTAGAGNLISGNLGNGIAATQGNGAGQTITIQGNTIGLNAAGTAALPNTSAGITTNNALANSVQIGGTTTLARNVISGNLGIGVSVNSTGAIVEGNYIGTNKAGDADLGNGSNGISVTAHNVVIGGATAASRNVISGNDRWGLNVSGSSNMTVQNNYVGTNAAGDAAIGNKGQGVIFQGGASGLVRDNVLSGNKTNGGDLGLGIETGPGVSILGNVIGLNAAGTAALGNESYGVRSSATIGGTTPADRNIISGNGAGGILAGTNAVITGNYIGTDITGLVAKGNGSGITIQATAGVTVGGFTTAPGTGAGNIISGNTGAGINLTGVGSTGTNIRGNIIGLGADGSTDLGNTQYGIINTAAMNTTIGGDDADDGLTDGQVRSRNVISGNDQGGINIGASGSVIGTIVQGNYVGTNVAGTAKAANVTNGGIVVGSAPGTLVGGTTAGAGNVVSGNAGAGISISGIGGGATVQGNFIGTNATGTAALGNSTAGITIANQNNVIGGTTALARNVISGNLLSGVSISSPTATGNAVLGNYIGTTASGGEMLSGGVGWWQAEPGLVPATATEYYASHNGSFVGTASYTAGKVGQAFNFDRTNYVSIPDSLTLSPTQLTIEGWAKPNFTRGTSPGADVDIVYTRRSGTSNDLGYQLAITHGNTTNYLGAGGVSVPQGTLAFYADIGGTLTQVLSPANPIPNDGQFHHVAATFNGTTMRLYLDGAQVASLAAAGSISHGTGPAFIGSTPSHDILSKAAIDEVGLFSAALSASDVQLIYNQGSLGKLMGNRTDGVLIDHADSNTIGGSAAGAKNVISGNFESGVEVSGGSATLNRIQGNYIGTDPTGTFAVGNASITTTSAAGVSILTGSNNIVGTDGDGTGDAAEGNLISGNLRHAIRIQTNTTVVAGNIIGLNAAGNAALPNRSLAISVLGTFGNRIGTNADGKSDADEANVISGNLGTGVDFADSINAGLTHDNSIAGNFIGTDKTGTLAFPNSIGITIRDASKTIVGGTVPTARNVISGNTGPGVLISGTGSTGNTIIGNYIGVKASGLTALANGSVGVQVVGGASNNTIGGTAAGTSNVISGQGADGVRIDGSGAPLSAVAWFKAENNLNNSIGTGSAGTINGSVSYATGVAGGTAFDFSRAAPGYVSSSNSTYALKADKVTIEGWINLATLPTGSESYLVASNDDPSTPNYLLEVVNNGGTRLQFRFVGSSGIATVPSSVISLSTGSFHHVAVTGDGTSIRFYLDGALITTQGYSGNTPTLHFNNVSNDPSITLYIGGTTGATNRNLNGKIDDLAVYGRTLTTTEIAHIYSAGGKAKLGTPNNTVQGNFIGVDKDGLNAIPNVGNGINVIEAYGNTIGGMTTTARNIVSSNNANGIVVTGTTATSNTIAGNHIGTNAAGTLALANAGKGVLLTNAPSNTIGGATSAARNVISGNTGGGIYFDNANSNTIQNNYIGTDAAGTGTIANGLSAGLRLTNTSSNAAVSQNLISGNAIGVYIDGGAATNQIKGNLIGTDESGLLDLGNTSHGIQILTSASLNTVGGTTAADRNIISGNDGNGILINTTSPNGNTVLGNYIGTDITGAKARPNFNDGVEVLSKNNTIGGTTAGAGNIISGNINYGVAISGLGATTNVVQGNRIGTDFSGNSAVPNFRGVYVSTPLINTIGGSVAGAGNQISGNASTGIVVEGAVDNVIRGNLVGTKSDGLTALPNLGGGIWLSSGVRTIVGGTTEAERNIISGNQQGGIYISGTAALNRVIGNYIGLGSDGNTPVPNSFSSIGNPGVGIQIYNGGQSNFIGGTAAGEGNVISGNASAGILITRVGGGSTSMNNTIVGNLIGTDATGMLARGNQTGIVLNQGANNNTIGGTTAAARNVISGNAGNGVLITDAGATANVVAGNFIGVDISGLNSVGNNTHGVAISNGADGNTIGGPTFASRNVISGQTNPNTAGAVAGFGVAAFANNTVIQNNYIGTDSTGNAAASNSGGIAIQGSNVLIRDNVLSGNKSVGVVLLNSTSTKVTGNRIGTNAAGNQVVNNGTDGVYIIGAGANNTIGGSTVADRNVISGNLEAGVRLAATNTGDVVSGNYIGTDASGTSALGNGSYAGVWVESSSAVQIGGLTATPGTGLGNLISGNATGILLAGSGANTVQGNLIGTTVTGSTALANTSGGVSVGSLNNIVGGTVANARNVISGNGGFGVHLNGAAASGTVIASNYVGLNAAGTSALGNTSTGIYISGPADHNAIGLAGAGNVISGNNYGISNEGGTRNVIRSNFVGTDATGTVAIGNNNGSSGSGYGHSNIYTSGPDTIIGGSLPGEGNLIAGAAGPGIWVRYGVAAGTQIQGNLIGTNGSSTTALGNTGSGIVLTATTGIEIGGLTSGARNVISGNGSGIGVIDGTTNTVVHGNYIGTDASGTVAIPQGYGVSVGGNSGANLNLLIGGAEAGAGNVISGSTESGVAIYYDATGVTVQGNRIGVGADGVTPIPNKVGVDIGARSFGNIIGGTTTGQGNTIAYSSGAGVVVTDALSQGNQIRGNSIFANTKLAIDLGGDGPTLNDADDGDNGPNGFINFPVLTAGTVGPKSRAKSAFAAAANQSYSVDFFASDLPGAFGYGQGQYYLGSATVMTNDQGKGTFDVDLLFATSADQVLSMTATDTAGNTSEFSLIRRSNVSPFLEATDLALTTDASLDFSVVRTVAAGITTLNGQFIDNDTANTYTVVVEWGDGNSNQVNVDSSTISGGFRHFSTTHTYPANVDQDQIFTPLVRVLLTETAEGKPVRLSGQFTDPDTADTHTVTIAWRDGTTSTVTSTPRDPTSDLLSFVASHVYVDDPTNPADNFAISVTVADNADASAAASTDVVVRNLAPLATFVNDGPAPEGGFATLSLINPIDPSPTDLGSLTYSFDFDNDGVFEVTGSPTPSVSVPAAYLVDGPGSRIVHGRVNDKDGGFTDLTANLRIANVAPTITGLATNATTYAENDTVVLSGTVSDPGILDGRTVVINWGDGLTSTLHLPAGTRMFQASHQYPNDPPGLVDLYHIQVIATDKDGAAGMAARDVTVVNTSPKAVIRGVDGGNPSNITLTSDSFDAGPNDTLTYSWTATRVFANGTSQAVATATTKDFAFAWQNNSTYIITLDVSDPDGGTSQDVSMVVSGTDLSNSILVDPGSQPGKVLVTVDGNSLGEFAPGARVIVFGGASADTIAINPTLTIATNLNGEAGNDTMTGGSGPDLMTGGIGADCLVGGLGNDTLDGGDGDDTTAGQLGDDWYSVVPGSDNVLTEPGAGGGNDTIDYSQAHLGISFSINAALAGQMQEVDSAHNKVEFQGQFENLIGSAFVDKLIGNDEPNIIFGGDLMKLPAGQTAPVGMGDTLDGGAGSDTVTGGIGNDTVIGGTGSDTVAGGAGNDVIFGGDALVIDPNPSTRDSLVGGPGSDSITGGTGNDVIFGGDPSNRDALGSDSIVAGAGDDRITLGAGSDTVLGGTGNDVIFGGDPVDPSIPTGSDSIIAGAGSDIVIGGSGNDVIFGGDRVGTSDPTAIDSLVGGAGSDSIIGGAGNDVIFGGDPLNRLAAGNDTVAGGAGNDSIIGGMGNDVIFGGDPVSPMATGDDTITGGAGSDSIVGGLGNDVIFGGDVFPYNPTTLVPTAPDSTVGGGGVDSLFGGAGNDVIFGGAPISAAPGTTFPRNTISGGSGNDTVRGGSGNDVIFGGDAFPFDPTNPGTAILPPIDMTVGGSGDDSLLGGPGNDVIFGGTPVRPPAATTVPQSTLSGGSGNDTVRGGSGNDVIFGGDPFPITTTNPADTLPPPIDPTAGGSGLDSLVGGPGNDVIFGGSPINSAPGAPAPHSTLAGGSGNDTVRGGSGNDVIFGGDAFPFNPTNPAGATLPTDDPTVDGPGDDSLLGGPGNDVIFGGSPIRSTPPAVVPQSTLSGGSGNDTVRGGSGNDVIFGGDAFPFNSGTLAPTTPDSTLGGSGIDSLIGGPGNDVIFGGSPISAGPATSFPRNTLSGGSGNDTVRGGSGNDVIFGGDLFPFDPANPGSATLPTTDPTDGGPGNDSLLGGPGNDVIFGGSPVSTAPGTTPPRATLSGGSGNDTVRGGSGNDVIFGGDPFPILTTNPADTLPPPIDPTAGGSGIDSLLGGPGDDVIFGGTPVRVAPGASVPPSTLSGGTGNDTVRGGSGNDVIFGGDPFPFSPTNPPPADPTSGIDSLHGGAGDDQIAGGSGIDTIDGGAGNDVVFAGSPIAAPPATVRSSLVGGTGNDTIRGGSGNDVIFGGDPIDLGVTGLPDANLLDGGAGDDSITGGIGSDSMLGGTGHDTIRGGLGNDTMSGGSGNDVIFGGSTPIVRSGPPVSVPSTVTGGSGNDVIFGGDIDTLVESGDASFVLTDTSLVNQSSHDADVLANIGQAILTGGASDNTLDARGFSGSVTLGGLAGNDTLLGASGNDLLDGGSGNDSLAGGGGDDEYRFAGSTSGSDVVNDPAGNGKDAVNFLGLSGPVQFNLNLTGAQAFAGGSVALVDPAAMTKVTGTVYADFITGNALANTLIGAGGEDRLVGGDGNDLLQAGVTQVVYLDFATYSVPDKRDYTQEDRDAIQARLEADYSDFGYKFTQNPTSSADGPYITVFFNKTPFFLNGVAQSGGISDEVDWRNLGLGGTVSVDVNGFLGYSTKQLTPTSANFVAISATIAAHELGHLSGLRHADAFGPIGSGVYIKANADAFLPVYPGPVSAVDTALHVMSSPASTRSDLIAAAGDTFFGEREALKLAFFDTGTVTAEQTAAHGSRANAQELNLAPVYVPNTLRAGTIATATAFSARAADVIGSIVLTSASVSENDFYKFQATAGDVVTIELLSKTLARFPNGIDSILRVYDHDGNLVEHNATTHSPAVNDDNFENQDALLIDVPLAAGGWYFIEVDTFTSTTVLDNDTGDYELFAYTSKPTTLSPSLSGDVLVGGNGIDTLIASSGQDHLFADSDGPTAVETKGVAPPSQPPVGTAQTAFEGTQQPFHLGSFTDTPANGPWSAEVNWGDGSPVTTFAVATTGVDATPTTWTLTDQLHTYPQNGAYSVNVKVTNAAELSSTKVFTVTVANVRPTVTAPTGGQPPLTVGQSATINLGSFTDPAVDNPWAVVVNWGDGSVPSTFTQTTIDPLSLDHGFLQPGTNHVSVTVTDKDGGSDHKTFDVSVAGVASLVSLNGNPTTLEGATYQLGVTTTSLVSAYTIDWGDGTAPQPCGRLAPSETQSHVYADGPNTHTISIAVVAGTATYAAARQLDVEVRNVVPTVTTVNPTVTTVVGHAAQNTGTWFDPGQDTVALSASVGTVIRNVNGTWTWSFGATTVQSAQPVTITATDSDGAVATTSFTLTVNPVAVTTIISAPAITYGGTATVTVSLTSDNGPPSGTINLTVDGASTLSATLAANGTATFTLTGLNAGDHSLASSYAAQGGFTASIASGTLTVGKATQTIAWATPASIVYGTPIGSAQLNATAQSALTYNVSAGTVLHAGSYLLTVTAAATSNYNAATRSVALTVTPAPLTIKANNASKIYGQPNPSFTATYTGLVNGDLVGSLNGTLVLTTSAGTASASGSYTITPSGPTSPDYTVAFQTGTLTINPAGQTVSWSTPTGITYGTALSTTQLNATVSVVGPAPAGALSYTAVVGGGTPFAISSGTVLNANTYTLTATAAATTNYTAASRTVTLIVAMVAPTVTVTDASGFYTGAAFPATATVRGVSGSAAASLEGVTPTISYYAGTTAAGTALSGAPMAVGTYTAKASFAGSTNYTSASATVTFFISVPLEGGYVLNGTASGAVTATGSATISLPGGLFVDSNSVSAVVASGSAKVQPNNGNLQVIGGVSRSGSAVATKTGSNPPLGDPLASLPMPGLSGLNTYGAVTVSGSTTTTLQPGIYTSITVSGSAHVTLASGTYVIRGGGFTVSGSASVTGTKVLLFNAGSTYNGTTDSGTYGAITLGGSGAVNLTPPDAGSFVGILIFQSRSNTKVINISGSASMTTTGTIYAAAAQLAISGSGTLHDTLVVNTLYVSGSAGAFQLSEGAASDYAVSTSNMLVNPILTVAVQDDTGAGLDPVQVNELGTAMTYLNTSLAQFGVNLSWAPTGTAADVHIHFAPTTPQGGAAQGVLGFTTADNDVYFAAGWNMYHGADPAGIQASQYDFLTLATHELAHTVGLGESADVNSVMYEYLAAGTVRREFTESNLTLINTDADRFMKVATPAAPPIIRDLAIPAALGAAKQATQAAMVLPTHAERNLLVGGIGTERVIENAPVNILNARSTSHDGDNRPLSSIIAAWMSSANDAIRVSHLTGTFTNERKGTVRRTGDDQETEIGFNAPDIEALTCSTSQDWFLPSKVADSAPNDRPIDDVTKLAGNES